MTTVQATEPSARASASYTRIAEARSAPIPAWLGGISRAAGADEVVEQVAG